MTSTPHNLAPTQATPIARKPRACLLVTLLALLLTTPTLAQYRPDLQRNGTPSAPLPMEIAPRIDATLPLDLAFTRHDGTQIKLADAFNQGKPVILSLVYLDCPNVCQVTQDSLVKFVKDAPRGVQLGKDYDILVVSIDPDDTPAAAATKRKNYLAKVPLPESQQGFTYLLGSRQNVRTLADAVGFPFTINPPGTGDKIAHPAGIFVCTPDGHLAQAIGGQLFEFDLLHNQLREASKGKIGSGILGAMLSCGAMYFNPNTGKYEHNKWFWVGTAGGLLTIGFMATFLTYLFRTDAKRDKALAAAQASPATSEPPS